MTVQPGLYQYGSQPKLLVFSREGSISGILDIKLNFLTCYKCQIIASFNDQVFCMIASISDRFLLILALGLSLGAS